MNGLDISSNKRTPLDSSSLCFHDFDFVISKNLKGLKNYMRVSHDDEWQKFSVRCSNR